LLTATYVKLKTTVIFKPMNLPGLLGVGVVLDGGFEGGEGFGFVGF
jgi:hypothetical protein